MQEVVVLVKLERAEVMKRVRNQAQEQNPKWPTQQAMSVAI